MHQRSLEDPDTSGMGTTLTVAEVEDGVVSIGHVGDSRAYLVRDGNLEQLTEDHSLVGELMRTGKLSAEEAETHPQRSMITRALGTDPDVDVDIFSVDAARRRSLPALLRWSHFDGRRPRDPSTRRRATAATSTGWSRR